jgi:trk/ktr system potassium uptake protein
MNIKFSLYVIGTFLKFFGLLLLIPAICSFIYRDGDLYIFLLAASLAGISGFLLETAFKESKNIDVIDRKEAFFIAFLCWMAAGVFGAVPYLFIPVYSSPVDALFESISGFTTTGATVISDIESLPHGILFYRSFTQWLGGMGIIILGIAILPKLSVGGVQLMGSEAPGPVTEKLTPKIAETAKKLWLVYIVLSLLFIVLLSISGMPVFDSIATSFSTLSTGGFSVKNSSIEGYDSTLIEVLITFFMFLGGINFLLHYYFLSGRFSKVFKSSELKYYTFIAILFIFIVSLDLWHTQYQGFFEALRYSSFQVVSILSTTGFSSVNFDLWTQFAIFVLFMLMFIGGCAGSTSGSIKVVRILILIKKIFSREINHLVKPRVVQVLKVDKKAVSDDVISSVTGFILLYILIFILSVLLLLLVEDISIIGALSACAASIGNVGPGFQEFGPTQNYDFLSDFSKLWLSLLMLIGRLEIFTVLVILSPVFWRK